MNAYANGSWLIGRTPPYAGGWARVGQIGTPARCRTSCVVRQGPSILAPAVVSQGRPLVVSGAKQLRVQTVLPSGWANVMVDIDPTTSLGGYVRVAELVNVLGGPFSAGPSTPGQRTPGPGQTSQFPIPVPRFPEEREQARPDQPPPPPPAPPKTDPELTGEGEPKPAGATPTTLERAAEIAVLLSPLWGAFLLSIVFPPRGS